MITFVLRDRIFHISHILQMKKLKIFQVFSSITASVKLENNTDHCDIGREF